MRTYLLSLTALCMLQLYAGTSVEVGAMSNYLAHGVTQTEDKPSAYIEIDWNNESGLFLGSKITGVQFLGDEVGYGGQMDFYGGYTLEQGELAYTLSLSYTHYVPGDYRELDAILPNARLNTSEPTHMYIKGFDFANVGLDIKWKALEAGISYTFYGMFPDDYAYSKGDLFYHIKASHDFDYGINAAFTIGHYNFDIPTSTQNYTYFEVKAYKNLGEFGDLGFAVDVVQGTNRDSSPIFVLLYKKAFSL